MKLIFAFAFALLSVTLAKSQPSANTGSIKGTVVCDDTHSPARSAGVSLEVPRTDRQDLFTPPSQWLGATTETDGSFSLSNVPAGEYFVVVSYAGYISGNDYIYPGALSPEVSGEKKPLPAFIKRVTITSGTASNVEIHLKRGASITGTVTYSDGAPVPYVGLTPKIKLSNGHFTHAMVGASQSDGSGRYRLEGLADGSYIVIAGYGGDRPVVVFGGSTMGGADQMIFAGNTMRPSKARLVDVHAPNEYTGVDVTIPVSGGHTVSGTVAARDGHAVNHGLVRLYPEGEPDFTLAASLAADGTFIFYQVPPDHYTLRVEDASDWKMIPTAGILHYDQPTLVRNYETVSTNLIVADKDVSSVLITVSPSR